MSDSEYETGSGEAAEVPPRVARSARRRWRKRRLAADIALVCFAVSLGIMAGLYVTRERLATDLIESSLDDYGVPAQYDIASIGPQEQVIENIVVGDPASPDLTVKRAIIAVRYRFGTPTIGGITLEEPRLYGRWADGQVSFGSLDSVIHGGDSTEPMSLPDLALTINDGRALVMTPAGDIGAKIQGGGNLADGFSGVMGAVMPDLAMASCRGEGGSLYGRLASEKGTISFTGPLRLAAMACDGATMGASALQLRVTSSDFASFRLRGKLDAQRLASGEAKIDRLLGDLALTRDAEDETLVSNFDLVASKAQAMGADASRLRFSGRVRSGENLSRLAFNGELEGEGLRPGSGIDAMLAGWQQASGGTMAEPLLARMRKGLREEGENSTLLAELQARGSVDGRMTLTIPSARWRGSERDTLLSLSRMQISMGGDAPMQMTGNFATGGRDLPRITGQMEDGPNGSRRMRLVMAEYGAGDARLSIPELRLRQNASGGIAMDGTLRASGAFPGGTVEDLVLPVTGGLSPGGTFALGTRCMDASFARMTVASLVMQEQSLRLCPPSDGAMLVSRAGDTRIAAGTPSLDLAGMLGETAVKASGGPVAIAFPGVVVARDMAVQLGEGEAATNYLLSELTVETTGELRGSFDDTEMRMVAVPLDVTRASGDWVYENDALTVSDIAMRVTDRQTTTGDGARFNPMVASGATVTLAENRIVVDADLAEETTGRKVSDVAIVHDLPSGIGHADFDIANLEFGDELQPTDLSPLALGNIANAEGVVTGDGRIDWSPAAVTSTGTFTTDSLDFAAAFGPVKGMAGTIRFTDLLGMVTAPNQKLTVQEINPGIPVENGVIDIALEPGFVLAFNEGKWPFLGGTLEMRPVKLTIGADETRRYEFVIDGLDAAKFLARMDMANLSATGTFDGTIPVIFDAKGGRIEGGFLQSRAPGGNLSYVGALTYEDMPAMANFAFDALKSMDYDSMTIAMDGSLEGQIVTRVTMDGVSQGEGASKNILTRRIASLPIRFKVNIRAPFYQLLTSLKSLYDPAAVRDPRTLGLLDAEDGALVPNPDAPDAPVSTTDLPPVTLRQEVTGDEPAIQTAESEIDP
ncbi:YdbH domain-containing protein [Croceicoccus mobilis]|nr:YdbH domain-containing protein [Croceicoccus mobilis]